MRPIDADALLKGKDDHEMISTHLIFNAPTLKVIKAEVLDEIRAEIDEKISHYEHFSSSNTANGLMIAKKIIDKYRAESEDSE